jgi:phosphoglycolate phosphatase
MNMMVKSSRFQLKMLVDFKKPSAIFFDWDGTFVDSMAALHAYYNHVLSHFGMPPITLEQAQSNIRRSAREVFPEIFGEKAEEALSVFYSFVEAEHLKHLQAFDGADDFLNGLTAYNIPMGIVSNKKHSFLLKEISHVGWDKHFVSNIGAGIAEKDKPAPDPLLLAARQINMSPPNHNIWYVGDTETDMQAAQAAGFELIFIEHGLGRREDCLKHGLNPYFVKDFGELESLVQ